MKTLKSRLLKRVVYPKLFPILVDSDFCDGTWNRNKDGHDADDPKSHKIGCLEGWALVVMERRVEKQLEHSELHSLRSRPYYKKLQQAVLDIIPSMAAELVENEETVRDIDIPDVNDADASKSDLPRIWNRFGALMGYTSGNPEA